MRRKGFGSTWIVLAFSGVAFGEPIPSVHQEETQTSVVNPSSPDLEPKLSDEQWLRSTSAFENRSVEIAETAKNLQQVVQDIQQAGRLSRLTQLSTLTIQLDREIGRANLASEYIDKP